MCYQPSGTGVWTWLPGQASVPCRAVLYCDWSTLWDLLFASRNANHISVVGVEFGSGIPGHSLLQSRLERLFAWWHRWEDTHGTRIFYAVAYICVEYFCRVFSIIVFCHTNGFMGLWKINDQGRSISTLVIKVSSLGKAIHCAKPNLKCWFEISALWKHSRNSR